MFPTAGFAGEYAFSNALTPCMAVKRRHAIVNYGTMKHAPTRRASSSRPLSGGPAAVGAAPSSSALDVPGHAEATLRLHKARIRGLEDEMAKLTQSLTGKLTQTLYRHV